jgi:dCMP deaminase
MNNKWKSRFLDLAHHVAAWSKDPSTKVGAVIVRPNKSICSIGFNGFPQGVIDSATRYYDREQKYPRIVHAEMNAILFAVEPIINYTLFTWPMLPCSTCAGAVIQSGIKKVVSIKNINERWEKEIYISKSMFYEAEIECEEIDENESDLQLYKSM